MPDAPLTHYPDRPRTRIIRGLAVGLISAIGLNAVVAAIAHQAGASQVFTPLQPDAYLTLTVIGFLAGAGGWAAVRSRTATPGRLLGFLVPTVLLLSLVPDVAVGISDQPGVSWVAVAALMVMHVVVAAAVVSACLRVLPLRAATAGP